MEVLGCLSLRTSFLLFLRTFTNALSPEAPDSVLKALKLSFWNSTDLYPVTAQQKLSSDCCRIFMQIQAISKRAGIHLPEFLCWIVAITARFALWWVWYYCIKRKICMHSYAAWIENHYGLFSVYHSPFVWQYERSPSKICLMILRSIPKKNHSNDTNGLILWNLDQVKSRTHCKEVLIIHKACRMA